MPLYKIQDAPRASPTPSGSSGGDATMKDATPSKVPSASGSATCSRPDSPDTHQPAQSGPPTVANAHFGHSIYFIEHLFPSKLWRILDDAERCGYDHVISWVDNGMAFQIREYCIALCCAVVARLLLLPRRRILPFSR